MVSSDRSRDPSYDVVAGIEEDWRRLRPDLDLVPVAVIGRVLRAGTLALRARDRLLAEHDLTSAELDILSALRRREEPQTPTGLARALLFSGPATTKRLARLEGAGLVRRRTNPDDQRGYLIHLTAKGRRLVDRIIPALLDVERELVSVLPARRQRELADLLRALLADWESRG